MNRNAIIKHIEHWVNKLGSASKVASECKVSSATLSLLLAGKYGANEEKVLAKIAAALNYRENDWSLVRTIGNYQTIAQAFADAKHESMWFAISNKAGSGKTGTLEDIYNRDMTGAVTFIQAEEWTGRQFLIRLISKTVGEAALKGRYRSLTELVGMVSDYFNEKASEYPVLIIDEADKLRPAAFRSLIPLFNRTEDRLGLLISGTENLKKEIQAGVRLHKKGYDEVESRFGRSYLHLPGATKQEVAEICMANGLECDRVHERIWNELETVAKPTMVRTSRGEKEILVEYAEDFRRIKRLIKREKLIQKQAA